MHSDTRFGENLAAGKDLDIAQAVQMWASEGKKYTYSPVYDFDMFTGHYTQVVWRKTTHIGCARVSCGKNVAFVCRYSPAGNRIGSAPY
jgi:pathogenesis-related protein 1